MITSFSLSLSHRLHSLPAVGNMKRRSRVPRGWSPGSYYSSDTVTHINVKRRLQCWFLWLNCSFKAKRKVDLKLKWRATHFALMRLWCIQRRAPARSWTTRIKESTSLAYINLGALQALTSGWQPFGPTWLLPSLCSGAQAVWPTQKYEEPL